MFVIKPFLINNWICSYFYINVYILALSYFSTRAMKLCTADYIKSKSENKVSHMITNMVTLS